jgi:V8-like Glu-specific endopeptidase
MSIYVVITRRNFGNPQAYLFVCLFVCLFACLGWLNSGCGDGSSEEAVSLEVRDQRALVHETAIVDWPGDRGQKWVRRRKVEVLDGIPVVPELRRPTSHDFSRMSDVEVASWLRPIMLDENNVEYELEIGDTLKLAREIKAHLERDSGDDQGEAAAEFPIDPQNGLSFRNLWGKDDRVNMNSSAGNFPWSNIAAMASATSVGSGFKMINHYTMITAAHVVYGSGGWVPRKAIQFAAGSSTPLPAMPSECYSIVVPGGWVGDVGDAEYDYAVIRFRGRGEWCDFNSYNVGYFGYKSVDKCTTSVAGNVSGYPGTGDPERPPQPWNYPSLFSDYRQDGWTNCFSYFNHLFYRNDSSAGQSGGPFWGYWDGSAKVRAIHHGAITGDNAGVKIKSSLIDWFKENAGK